MKTPNIQSIYFLLHQSQPIYILLKPPSHLHVTTFPHICSVKKEGGPNMNLNRNAYTVEAAAGGGFYAYFMNNVLCSAYGETPDEACENLEQIVDDFVSDMYMVEEFV